MIHRINISVPAEMYEELKRFKLKPSKIAQQAFMNAIRAEHVKLEQRTTLLNNAQDIINNLQQGE